MDIEKERNSTFDLCYYRSNGSNNNNNSNSNNNNNSNSNNIKEWVWSKNDSPIRKSAKQYSYSNIPLSHEEQIEKLYPKKKYQRNKYDDNQQEYEDEHDNDEIHKNKELDNMFDFKQKFTRNNVNRHKTLENKRSMIIQTKINPYLKKNKYLDDIQTQDDFLRPKNSNIEC